MLSLAAAAAEAALLFHNVDVVDVRDAARGVNNGCNQLPKSMGTMLVIIARRQEQDYGVWTMDQGTRTTPTPWTKHH